MLTLEQALDAVLTQARPLPACERPLEAAVGSILDEDVAADIDSPPFDKALVDGYAVRTGDLQGPEPRLDIGEVITAGRVPARPLGLGEAAVVMTGAPIPVGCDAVVMHEKTRLEDGHVVIEETAVRPAQNLLARGREMTAGSIVLSRGLLLNPARLGVLAAVGRASVRVVPRPCAAIVPTGDELVEPSEVPGPGQIRNSNAIMLKASALQSGADAETWPIAPDDEKPLRQALEAGLRWDVLMVTGGVSAGQRDLVPDVLASLGVQCIFHKVRLKPGKPLWFGVGPPRSNRGGSLVFGLPGNPVSVLVGFLLFVKPALAALAGKPEAETPETARLARGFRHRGDRPTYHPVKVLRDAANSPATLLLEPLAWSGSADLCTVAQADGFAAFEAGDREYGPGEIVGFLPMR
ncbi:MAG TPA: gephyrin-like molybdotransferase Glp [Isosphaeraceae bacterium]|nr:gephyrin-like molybdotransferase Glp [Isosphaeraceae bacterium]